MIISIYGFSVIIDDEDYERISSKRWFLHKTQYKNKGRIYFLCNNGNNTQVLLHRYILNLIHFNGMVVDHINGDTLDNRKCNLRICTQADNIKNRKKDIDNSSGYKGVNWSKSNKKYLARICVNKKIIYLGYHATAELAYSAYCEASKKYHGEYGRLE